MQVANQFHGMAALNGTLYQVGGAWHNGEQYSAGSDMWSDFVSKRGDASDKLIQAALQRGEYDGAGIGTPDDMLRHLKSFQDCGVDQVIMLQQAGKNSHNNICESLELFAETVMPEFAKDVEEREAVKAAELSPYIAAALERKEYMQPLAEEDVPVVKASVRVAGADDRSRNQDAAD